MDSDDDSEAENDTSGALDIPDLRRMLIAEANRDKEQEAEERRQAEAEARRQLDAANRAFHNATNGHGGRQ